MRVPRGAPSGLITTPAFSPNRIYDPSSRRVSFAVRTTTARTTSPFRTPLPGVASFTVGHYYVPDTGAAPLAATENPNSQQAPGAGVVRYP